MNSIIEKIKAEVCKPGYTLFEKIISGVAFFFDCIYRALLECSKVILLFIIVIVSAQVFCRFFSHSIMWSEEVALLLMVWTAFIALAIGVEKGLHIAITIFFNHFPKKVQWCFNKIILLSMIFFGYILIVYGIKLAQVSMGNLLPATQWPNGIKFIMMPVSGIFVCYFAIFDLFGLSKYRHLNIEDGHRTSEKTDQQIIDEMRAQQAEKAVATEEDQNV